MKRILAMKIFSQDKNHPVNCQDAFTLVELLVVIAIISVLAGMLMPALENAIESSRTISCASNLKQLGIADLSYVDDNDGYLAPYYGVAQWTVYLRQYLGDNSMNANTPFSCDANPYKKHGPNGGQYTNYAMNLVRRVSSSDPYRNISNVKKPSDAVSFGDSSLRLGFSDGECVNYFMYFSPSGIIPSTSGYSICDGHLVHTDGMNLSFIDGHAKYAPDYILQSEGSHWFNVDD